MQTIREHKTFAILSLLAMLFACGGVLGSCFFESNTQTCGKDLRCRPGQTCAAHQDVCVDINGCGDGTVSGDEVCDDGNIISGDNCSQDCKSEEVCGNGIVDVEKGEECDLGSPTIDCDRDCRRIIRCGNSIKEASEECDTGGDSISCDMDCSLVTCADNHMNAAAGETCFATGGIDKADCDGDCTDPACGDGRTNIFFTPDLPDALPEACDTRGDTASCNGSSGDASMPPTGKGYCQRPSCGDWYRNDQYTPPGNAGASEQCDAGPTGSATCNGNANATLEIPGPGNCRTAMCGDGYTNTLHKPELDDAAFEQCDHGRDTESCNANQGRNNTGKGYCQNARCGDGYENRMHVSQAGTNVTEQCDTGVNTAWCNGNDRDNNGDDGPNGGLGNCQQAQCGDGYYNPLSEVCEWNAPNGAASCGPNEVCSQTGANACKCVGSPTNTR